MKRNAYFQLKNNDDGLYIILYPPTGGGVALTLSEIQQYLKRVQIRSYDPAELAEALERQFSITEIRLREEFAPSVGEILLTAVSKDKMSAYIKVYAASEEGRLLERRDILESLSVAGIRHGIADDRIDEWLENRLYCTNILIAEGSAPEESIDALIEYNFETEKDFRPTVKDDGSVDFHQLNLFNNVSRGDILAVLTPAYKGAAGMNVLGVAIPSKNPVKKTLKFGKNAELSEDTCVLTAAASGHIEMEGDRVYVENVYAIKGDVCAATGDVDFDGIVRITGDVLTGYTVKATADVFVYGVVEGAAVYAGGDIVIANGVHGGAKASISADGDITSMFIQESVVSAGGSVQAGSILYSTVTAGDSIVVRSGKGLVKGGELRARKLLSLKTVGSSLTGGNSLLEVGASPEETDFFRALEEELAEKRSTQTKLRQAWSFLQRKSEQGEQLKPDQIKMLTVLPHQLEILDESLVKLFEKYNAMKDEIERSDKGKILIAGIIYEGTKIIISNVSYYIREDLSQCQFEKKNYEIRVSSLDERAGEDKFEWVSA